MLQTQPNASINSRPKAKANLVWETQFTSPLPRPSGPCNHYLLYNIISTRTQNQQERSRRSSNRNLDLFVFFYVINSQLKIRWFFVFYPFYSRWCSALSLWWWLIIASSKTRREAHHKIMRLPVSHRSQLNVKQNKIWPLVETTQQLPLCCGEPANLFREALIYHRGYIAWWWPWVKLWWLWCVWCAALMLNNKSNV